MVNLVWESGMGFEMKEYAFAFVQNLLLLLNNFFYEKMMMFFLELKLSFDLCIIGGGLHLTELMAK